FGPLSGRFNSQATIARPERIHIAATSGPFRQMSIDWSFEPRPGGCGVRFDLEYELASKIVERLTGPVIDEAFSRIAYAFEERARSIYGSQ
ncbi:MAG: type II toxin-antitoxin system RatA family toxin, partial [Gammaproteobacteria bacterium]|nr:type II toxin-antitoxin system RatA family toxin [Gammaproteobacteria bacterium]